jgi:hypothetical protein
VACARLVTRNICGGRIDGAYKGVYIGTEEMVVVRPGSEFCSESLLRRTSKGTPKFMREALIHPFGAIAYIVVHNSALLNCAKKKTP